MGKRQIICRADRIAGNRDLLDREVNLVTREDRVWHGRIAALDQNALELRDARSGKHRFRLEQIDKIYYEIKTEY